MNNTPKLYGIRVTYREGKRERSEVLVWCPFCERVHVHGCDGVKAAHCRSKNAPESYEVVLVPWTVEQFDTITKYVTAARKEKRRLEKRNTR
jgi:hypothetical protein